MYSPNNNALLKFASVKIVYFTFSQLALGLSYIDTAVRKKRKKYGGNGRKLFTEGWIEFKDKRIARAVALSFNNTIIGNV